MRQGCLWDSQDADNEDISLSLHPLRIFLFLTDNYAKWMKLEKRTKGNTFYLDTKIRWTNSFVHYGGLALM